MKHGKILLVTVLLLGMNNSTAHAALESSAGGTMIYDTDRNITWVTDANLFRTQFIANPNLTSEIIAANSGIVQNLPNSYDGNDRVYNLNASDFGTGDGRLNWFAAKAWVNSLEYGGISDWRLPTITDTGEAGCDESFSGTDCGDNVDTSGSELAHLFYDELGLKAATSANGEEQSGYGITAETGTGFIQNIQTLVPYWSATDYATDPSAAWDFWFHNGSQSVDAKGARNFAWAIRDGDVAPVLVPGAIWLFGSTILGFAGIKRCKS